MLLQLWSKKLKLYAPLLISKEKIEDLWTGYIHLQTKWRVGFLPERSEFKSNGMSDSLSNSNSHSSAVNSLLALKLITPRIVQVSKVLVDPPTFFWIFDRFRILKSGYLLASRSGASLAISGTSVTFDLILINTTIFESRRFSSLKKSSLSRGPIGRLSFFRSIKVARLSIFVGSLSSLNLFDLNKFIFIAFEVRQRNP